MKAKAFIPKARLGQDAEVVNLDNGRSVINFSVASTKIYYDAQNDKKEETDWHDVKIFTKDPNEKFVDMLTKGSLVSVTGDINYSEYEDKNGSKQKRMYITTSPGTMEIFPSQSKSAEETE